METDSEAKKCPICVDGRRNPEHLVCSECFARFNSDKRKAQHSGKLWLVSPVMWTRVKATETLTRLRSELDLATQQKREFYPQAKKIAGNRLIADGAFSVEPTEFNRQAGKEFGVLLDDPKRAGDIFGILNDNPLSVKMIEEFLADIESLMGEEVKEEDRATSEQVAV